MKKLSEFKNEEAVVVIAQLLQPIFRIVNKLVENRDELDGINPLDFVSKMLEASPKDVIAIFAILSEEPVDTYECNGAELMANVIKLASDNEFMLLFGSQSQTVTSSGSALENTEGH